MILGFPAVAMASWWNPTTWFDKPEVIEAPVETQVVEITKEVPKTEYVETVKYVTVDNTQDVSALLAQIESLNSQVVTLQAQNTCPNEEYRQSLLSQIAEKETRITEIDEEIRNYPLHNFLPVMPAYEKAPLDDEKAQLQLDLVILYNDLNTI